MGFKIAPILDLNEIISKLENVLLIGISSVDYPSSRSLRGAIELSLDDLRDIERVDSLKMRDKSLPIVVYCEFGLISIEAAVELESKGFETVYSVEKGLEGIKLQYPDLLEPVKKSKEMNALGNERYKRQMMLPQVGQSGQESLSKSRVLVVGAGGLGSPVLSYLCAAGIGNLQIIDGDDVDVSNLHRQPLHFESDIGKTKVKSAFDKLSSLNSNCHIEVFPEFLSQKNIDQRVKDVDLVVDASDNMETRFLLNQACHSNGIPMLFAGIFQFEGQICLIHPDGGPCLQCLFPEPPPASVALNCQSAGVLGPFVGAIGSFQANIAMRYLVDRNYLKDQEGTLFMIDGENFSVEKVKFSKAPDCQICGTSS